MPYLAPCFHVFSMSSNRPGFGPTMSRFAAPVLVGSLHVVKNLVGDAVILSNESDE